MATLSIVIPVYNDANGIEITLHSLLHQTYPRDGYEILVVDNGSTDRTPEAIASFAKDRPGLITQLTETDIQSSYAARNRGIQRSSGEVIAFIDADMHVDDDWVENVLTRMRETGWQYMACNVEAYIPDGMNTPVARFDRAVSFNVQTVLDNHSYALTCCLVTTKSLFDTVGLFDSELTSSGDCEFGHRVYRAGVDQHFASDITMYHPVRTSLSSALRRQFRFGRGFAQLEQRYPDRYRRHPMPLWKFIVPPLPSKFLERTGEVDARKAELPILYCINYLYKLSTAAGKSYQRTVSA